MMYLSRSKIVPVIECCQLDIYWKTFKSNNIVPLCGVKWLNSYKCHVTTIFGHMVKLLIIFLKKSHFFYICFKKKSYFCTS